MDSNLGYYNAVFDDGSINKINLTVKRGIKIKYIIAEYYKRIQKTNLLVQNIDNIYFVSNTKRLDNRMDDTLESIFNNVNYNFYRINVINERENNYDYEIIETIKENVFTTVFKAKMKYKNQRQNILNSQNNSILVAIKKYIKIKLKKK